MKLREYISKLEALYAEHGDLQMTNKVIKEHSGEGFIEYIGNPVVEDVEGYEKEYETDEVIDDVYVVVVESRLE